MISALAWVPRGAAKATPEFAEPTEEELREAEERLKLQVREEDGESDEEFEDEGEEEEADENEEATEDDQGNAESTAYSRQKNDGLEDELAELNMDGYDEEDDDVAGGVRVFGSRGFGGAYYAANDKDPYITLEDDEDEDEIEDFTIRPTDSIILTAKSEDDVSLVEVWICEEASEEDDDVNLYVHHDIILPAFPLCLAWMDINPTTSSPADKANFVAVGSMQPGIEIWNLDLMDAVEPTATLGGFVGSELGQIEEEGEDDGLIRGAAKAKSKKGKKEKGKKQKKGKAAGLKEGSHEGAVLGLSWNREFRNVLASGGEDCSVRVWDLVAGRCERVLRHHQGKVQAVEWNPLEAPLLLSGSFDRTVALADARAPDNAPQLFAISGDVESLAWDPHDAHKFVVSSEDGFVHGFDARSFATSAGSQQKPLFQLHAHNKAACSVAFNHKFSNMLATSSTDKTVKIWDLANNAPSCLASTNPKLGAVFSVSFCGDDPYILAMGGSKGKLDVWNTKTNVDVVKRFHV